MKYKQKFYYSDELKDEVIDFKIKRKKIDENYQYIHKNKLYNIVSNFVYYFALPFALFTEKLIIHTKFKNAKILKPYKKTGYFIYGNHTNKFSDAISPAILNFPKKTFLIVNPDNIHMKIIGKITPMLGALPLPETIKAGQNFLKAVNCICKKNLPIVIYPEAHLWPFYTKIRNFNDTSFKYPIKENKPIFTFTTTYTNRKYSKKPKITIYVDGPFFADKNLSDKEQQIMLRNSVFSQMNERAKLSDYEYCEYIKKETL